MYALIKDISSEVTCGLFEGGPGSGHFGHKGRPGHRGGSSAGGNVAAHTFASGRGVDLPKKKVAMTPGGMHKKVSSNFMAKYLVKKNAQGKYATWDSAVAKLKAKYPGQPEARYERAVFKAGLRRGGGSLQTPSVKIAPKRPKGNVVLDQGGGGTLSIALTTGKVEKEDILGGGCNKSLKVKIDGDGDAIVKPKSGEVRGLRKHITKGTYYRREAAVSSVAKVVGMNDLVPETYVRNDPKHGVCSIQAFVKNGKAPGSATHRYGRSETDVSRAALLDFVIGNQDRHDGNYLIADGKLKLIDNGLSLATEGGYLRSVMFNRASENAMDIPKAVYETFISRRGDIEATLRNHRIEEEAIANMGKRYNSLGRLMNSAEPQKTFERLKIFHADDNGWHE